MTTEEVRDALIEVNLDKMNLDKLQIDSKLKDIMNKCWSYDPIERPSFDHIYYFFENYHNIGVEYHSPL